MAAKIVLKGVDKNYRATCPICNSEVEYKGSDIEGGVDNINQYIPCPGKDCLGVIMHDNWHENNYNRAHENNRGTGDVTGR